MNGPGCATKWVGICPSKAIDDTVYGTGLQESGAKAEAEKAQKMNDAGDEEVRRRRGKGSKLY
jgi:hypothetical protein